MIRESLDMNKRELKKLNSEYQSKSLLLRAEIDHLSMQLAVLELAEGRKYDEIEKLLTKQTNDNTGNTDKQDK
jgi:hypothetical protein